MMVDVVVQNPQKSNEYEYEKKHVRRDSRCAAAVVVSAVELRRPTKEYTQHPYSMMHRRLPTAGIEVAPHYHQLLITINIGYVKFPISRLRIIKICPRVKFGTHLSYEYDHEYRSPARRRSI